MSDPKTYTDDFAKFADRINRIEASIRNLRVPTDGQFTQTVKNDPRTVRQPRPASGRQHQQKQL